MTISSSLTSSTNNIITWVLSGGEAVGYVVSGTTSFSVVGLGGTSAVVVEPWPALVADGSSYKTMQILLSRPAPSTLTITMGESSSLVTMSISPSTVRILAGQTSTTFTVSVDHSHSWWGSDYDGDDDNDHNRRRRLLAAQDGVGGNLNGLLGFMPVSYCLSGSTASQFNPPAPANVTIYHRGTTFYILLSSCHLCVSG
jgi:hypothetical protein